MISLVVALMLYDIELPPKHFDHEPLYPYEVIEMPLDQLHRQCKIPKSSRYVLQGCADFFTNRIYMRDDLSPSDYAKVLRHEKAHLNGWIH